jgi:SAM-dependent methyltransferase
VDPRTASYEMWQAMAPAWDRNRGWMWRSTRLISEWMIEALAPEPGDTVLELACGTGETGFAAAQAVGPEGRIVQTDFSPAMVDTARGEARRLGLANVEQRVLDAERMDLDDDSVDGVLCRCGYMLMDVATALAETRRVLRDGGRVSLAVWAERESNPWATIGSTAMRERLGQPEPSDDEPGMFHLADPDRLRSGLEGAGFEDVRLELVEVAFEFGDAKGYWHFLTELAGGFSRALPQLPEEDREAIRADVLERVAPYEASGEMPGLALCAVAS